MMQVADVRLLARSQRDGYQDNNRQRRAAERHSIRRPDCNQGARIHGRARSHNTLHCNKFPAIYIPILETVCIPFPK